MERSGRSSAVETVEASELTNIPYKTVFEHTSKAPSDGYSREVSVPKQVAEPIQDLSLAKDQARRMESQHARMKRDSKQARGNGRPRAGRPDRARKPRRRRPTGSASDESAQVSRYDRDATIQSQFIFISSHAVTSEPRITARSHPQRSARIDASEPLEQTEQRQRRIRQ
ncbi:MAG: hypothetical protein ABSA81_01490 [Candidatus Bathyarchaeia archaeon]